MTKKDINYICKKAVIANETLILSDNEESSEEPIIIESSLDNSIHISSNPDKIIHNNGIEGGSNDSDKELESFFRKLRINKTPKTIQTPIQNFVISDDDLSSCSDEGDDYENILKYNTDNILIPDILSTPIVKTKLRANLVTCQTEIKPRNKYASIGHYSLNAKDDLTLNSHRTNEEFLDSLSLGPEFGSNKYVICFNRHKIELTQRLFTIYNREIFKNKLPHDMVIKWNPRLLKTAGQCYYKTMEDSSNNTRKNAWIELSTKVCDSACRVRDVLLHEMCHAAAWLISNYKSGHGKPWKKWAQACATTFPNLPLIQRCHSYEITTKFLYRCRECSKEVGRHSRSLDAECCSLCGGYLTTWMWNKKSLKYVPYVAPTIEDHGSTEGNGERDLGEDSSSSKPKPVWYGQSRLTENQKDDAETAPKGINKFAMYVKQNYGSVKKKDSNLAHRQIMLTLSAGYAKSKLARPT